MDCTYLDNISSDSLSELAEFVSASLSDESLLSDSSDPSSSLTSS